MIAKLNALELAKGDIERSSERGTYSTFPDYLDAIMQVGPAHLGM